LLVVREKEFPGVIGRLRSRALNDLPFLAGAEESRVERFSRIIREKQVERMNPALAGMRLSANARDWAEFNGPSLIKAMSALNVETVYGLIFQHQRRSVN